MSIVFETGDVAVGASAWASTISSSVKWPFLNGLAMGVAPAASTSQLALNMSGLQNSKSTPVDSLSASYSVESISGISSMNAKKSWLWQGGEYYANDVWRV